MLFNYICLHFPPLLPPPQSNPPPSLVSTLPLAFVHVSFIVVVPENPSPYCPLSPLLWLLLDCSLWYFKFCCLKCNYNKIFVDSVFWGCMFLSNHFLNLYSEHIVFLNYRKKSIQKKLNYPIILPYTVDFILF